MSNAIDYILDYHEIRDWHPLAGFSPDDIERQHDFIQWVFPTDQRSAFNPNAPVITAAEIAAIDPGERHDLTNSIMRSLTVMMKFYGFSTLGTDHPYFVEVSSSIFRTGITHHDLRMTRILRCLTLFNEPARTYVMAALEALADDQTIRDDFSNWEVPMRYWKEALSKDHN